MLVVLNQPPLVVRSERADDAISFAPRHAKAHQQPIYNIESGQKRLALQVRDPEIEQAMRMSAVARPCIDRQIRIAALHQFGCAHGGLHVIDGQHEGPRRVGVGRVENLGPACIPIERLASKPLYQFYLLRADVERSEGDALSP